MNKEALIQDFVRILRSDKKSEATVQSYSRSAMAFLAAVRKHPKRVKTSDIEDYKYELARKYAPGSILLQLAAIKSFLEMHNNFACERVKRPRLTKKDPIPLSEEEMESLLQASRTDPLAFAVITTLYYTGMRLSSLLNLQFRDILWDEGRVVLRNTKRGKTYTVLMPPQAMQAIRDYTKYRAEPIYTEDQEVVFISPTSRKPLISYHVQHITKKFSVQARITKRVYPHLLRHTHGTIARKCGTPLDVIARQLGHESIETTQIYAKLADETYEQAYEGFYNNDFQVSRIIQKKSSLSRDNSDPAYR